MRKIVIFALVAVALAASGVGLWRLINSRTYQTFCKIVPRVETDQGSIVLLHVMYDRERRSMGSVRPIIKGLREQGLQFTTVSDVFTRVSRGNVN